MLARRLTRIQDALQRASLDALVLNPGPTMIYASGLVFHLMERPVVFVIPAEGPPALILPEFERTKGEDCRLRPVLFTYTEDPASRHATFEAASRRLGLPSRRLGVEPLRMRVFELRLLEAASPGAQFLSAEDLITGLRVAKDAAEIETMRRAVLAAESAFRATVPLIKLGMTERELASELTVQLLRAGSDSELPFSPIVASGPNSALPHGVPTDRRLERGDFLIIDWGATVEGYISDLTRTLALEPVDPELARVHGIVLEANQAGRPPRRRLRRDRSGGTPGDRRRRIRAAVYPPHRPRHRHGGTRGALHSRRQSRAPRAGHDLHGRARHLPRRPRGRADRGQHRDHA